MDEGKMKMELGNLRALGSRVEGSSRELECFPAPARVTLVTLASRELTCHCPITKQPDYYEVTISYRPDGLCLESKSLKLYLWSFRDEACFAETLASRILEDIMRVTGASYGRVDLKQNVRGGIELTAVAEMTRD